MISKNIGENDMQEQSKKVDEERYNLLAGEK